MKKHNARYVKPHSLRGAFSMVLFAGLGVVVALSETINVPDCAVEFSPVLASVTLKNQALTFADRVGYQRAIEEVYWRYRIWPKENHDPKPSLDAAMSQAQLEKKVEDYLRNYRALEDYLQRPITAEQDQAQMDAIE